MTRATIDAFTAFEREIVAFGLVLPRGGVVADGTIHRIDDGQHRRKRNGAGWYVLHETPTGLLVGRGGSWWRDRGSFRWNSRGEAKLRPADRKAIAELAHKIGAERAEHYRQGAERAAVIWAAGEPCSSHPYLERKGVKSHGLRVDREGRLLIPARDLDANLRGGQRIDALGDKRFTFGTDRERPTCFVIGNLDEADTVVVVEGYATGATVFAAMGWPVVVAFDAGGLEKIAQPLRQRLPKATLVFAGDHDLDEKGGVGQKKAKRAARSAGGVAALPPIEGTDWNDHAIGKKDVCEAHGLDDVRLRLFAAAGGVDLPPTVTLAEGMARLDAMIGGFFAQALTWHDLPEEKRTMPSALLANATMGAGKSQMSRHHAGKLLRDKSAAVAFTLPLHRLTTEQAAAFKAETGHDAAIWRGMEQRDPERDDGATMCLQPELPKAAQDASVNVSAICKVCPSRNDCGYQRQRGQKARAWFLPHNLLFQEKPKAIPAPAALVTDEKFHDAGMAENTRLAVSTLEGDLWDVPHAGDRELLQEMRGMLLSALKASGATVKAPATRVRLTKTHLEAVGLTADLAQEARRIEWTRKPKPELSGDVHDILNTLQAMSGRFTSKVPTLWNLVEALLRGDHDEATTIEIEADAALQGGDGRGLLVWMHHRLDVHETWRAPTLLLDGTAKPEIVRHWFPDLVALPEIHIEAPHQRVTWVRASFAKARLTQADPTRSKNPDAVKRYNNARQNNLEDLRRYIEVLGSRFRRSGGGIDVLVVVNKDVEDLLRAGSLPANVAVEHFNNLRGTNDYEKVRAVIAVGRTLPDAAKIYRAAERMAGCPLDQDDPLVKAVRWSICEAELLQVIARARGIRRTEADPLDVFILGDVPLPMKIDTVASWEQAQPTPVELLAARGVVPACGSAAKGYWSTVQAVLPDVFKDVAAAKEAARGSRWESSMDTLLIDKSHRESWLPHQARPLGSRYAIPVMVDPDHLLHLAMILSLDPERPDDRPDPPPPGIVVPVPVESPAAALMDAVDPPALQAAARPLVQHVNGDGFADSDGAAAAVWLPAFAQNSRETARPPPAAALPATVEWPAVPDDQAPAEFLEPIKGADLPNPNLGVDLPEAFSDQYAREADPWPDYAGGIMPAGMIGWVRDRWRGSGLSQQELADLADISREQVSNVLGQRYGLSPEAAARLRAVVASLPVVQAALW